MTELVVVTGGAGFLGSNLVEVLVDRGYRVVAVDDLSTGDPDNVAHLAGNPAFRLIAEDIQDEVMLRKTCEGAAAVVHLAAKKIPRYRDGLETLTVNTQGTESVLEAARMAGAKVVLASTSDVYGKNPAVPFSEEDDLVLGPSAVRRWSYAASKIFDEHLCYAYRDHYGLAFTALRFFGAYGPRQNRTWLGGPQGIFIQAMIAGEAVEIHGDGLQTRTFTYVDDTVAGIVAAMESTAADGEVFNLGSTEEVSILELAHRVQRACGLGGELPVRFVPYESFGRYEDVRRRVPDISKAQRLLGFAPQVSLDDGLHRTVAWFRGSR